MPNRLLRDWTGSDKVNTLTVYAERFFTRLIMKADDYGCFYADVRILKANLFPLLLDSIREADLLRWMAECQKAGLIVLYESNDKKYLQIIEFNQRLRQKTQKFPMPTDDGHMTVNSQHEEKGSRIEEKGREQAIDLSNSNLYRKPVIPTKQQVLEAIINAGGSKEMAKSFWEKYEGTGWYNGSSPITNYVLFAQKFVDTWKRNDQAKVPESAPVVNLKTI